MHSPLTTLVVVGIVILATLAWAYFDAPDTDTPDTDTP